MAMLNFEKPIFELESKISELEHIGSKNGKVALDPEIKVLRKKLEKLRKDTYENLSIWDRVQIARHPDRPYTLDYIRMIMSDFIEIHGDRQFADDLAMIGGMATLDGIKVMVIGHQKGRDVKENVMRNFGCAHPEGYRKAIRLMQMAEKFKLPVVAFIDTPGAYPGIGAEERGQAQAIASNLRDMAQIATPIVATIIGEGGSGGAIGIGVADSVCILQHAYYSVISPEGCASILWRNAVKAPEAAEALKITGDYLVDFGIVDRVILEPLGGAHKDAEQIACSLKEALVEEIHKLQQRSDSELLNARYQKFRVMGRFREEQEKSVENMKEEQAAD